MLIIMLLLALKVLLITGYHELHEIEALKLKIEKMENITETQNEKIASLTKQLQQGLQEQTRSFTENIQKDVQKNQDDISKLNRGLITYRTWGTHCKFERTCI